MPNVQSVSCPIPGKDLMMDGGQWLLEVSQSHLHTATLSTYSDYIGGSVCVCVCVRGRKSEAREVEQRRFECDSAFTGLITVLSVCLRAYICARAGQLRTQMHHVCVTNYVATSVVFLSTNLEIRNGKTPGSGQRKHKNKHGGGKRPASLRFGDVVVK